jgi:hypothetical protein
LCEQRRPVRLKPCEPMHGPVVGSSSASSTLPACARGEPLPNSR